MLWILALIGICIIASIAKNGDDEDKCPLYLITFVFLILPLCIELSLYFDTKLTINGRIALLEETNERIISSVGKIVSDYTKYESGVFKNAKPTAEDLIAMSIYPEVKANDLFKHQLYTLEENMKEVYRLKEKKVMLNSYKPWLFMGE